MPAQRYADPAQQAVADAAYDEAFRDTVNKCLAISSLPNVSVSQAVVFVERGMSVEDVKRLSPEAVMRRVAKVH